MEGKIIKKPEEFAHYETWSTNALHQEVAALNAQAISFRRQADDADRKRQHVERLIEKRGA